MKTLAAVSVLFGTAILVLGAAAGQASAGSPYCWGSGRTDGGSGYGYAGRGGCGYGACGSGGAYGHGGDYERYIVGHGPMYPGGDFSTGYSYGAPTSTPAAPNTSPVPTTSVAPTRP